MPLPKPHKGESQSDFMSRCVPEAIGSGDDKRPQDQAVAMCLGAWRDAHPGAAPAPKEIGEWRDKLKKILARAEFDAPEPDDDEAYDDFMDRCMDRAPDDMDDDEAQQMCQTSWEDSHGDDGDGDIGDKRFKTHAEPVHGMEFVLSDETPDRIGDVITAAGWDLENFKKIRLRFSIIDRTRRSGNGPVCASTKVRCAASCSWRRQGRRRASTKFVRWSMLTFCARCRSASARWPASRARSTAAMSAKFSPSRNCLRRR